PGGGPPPRRLVLGGGLPHPQVRGGPRGAPGAGGRRPPLPGQHAGGPPMTPGAPGGGEGWFLERMAAVPVVAILRAADAGRFLEVGRVLYEGGGRAVEVTLTSEGALEAFARLRGGGPAGGGGGGCRWSPGPYRRPRSRPPGRPEGPRSRCSRCRPWAAPPTSR